MQLFTVRDMFVLESGCRRVHFATRSLGGAITLIGNTRQGPWPDGGRMIVVCPGAMVIREVHLAR